MRTTSGMCVSAEPAPQGWVLGQSVAEPAQWPSEHRVTVPATVTNLTAEPPEPVAHADEESGLVAILDLPRLFGCPAGARAAHRNLWMVAEVHHPVWIID